MDTTILDRFAYLNKIHFNLIFGPPKSPMEESQGEALQSLKKYLLAELSEHFKLRVFRPGIDRQLEDFLMDLHKSRLFVPPLHLIGNSERSAEVHGALIDRLGPIQIWIVGFHGIVITVNSMHNLLRLEPTAWTSITIGFLDDIPEVFKATEHDTRVDVIIGIWLGHPVFLGSIVDDEFEVAWIAAGAMSSAMFRVGEVGMGRGVFVLCRLDGGEISSSNLEFG
jgi:hypothetical protein